MGDYFETCGVQETEWAESYQVELWLGDEECNMCERSHLEKRRMEQQVHEEYDGWIWVHVLFGNVAACNEADINISR